MLLKDTIKQYYFRYIKYRRKNVLFKRNVLLNDRVVFEGNNKVFSYSTIKSSYIGFGTYIANNSQIIRAKVGKFCAIGSNVHTSLGIHPSKNFVSIHPAFFSTKKQAGFSYAPETIFEEHIYNADNYCVSIGNDVWIGNNVLIFDGVKISDGAIIGAGAVVTKDVKPYSIVTGVPATHLRYRFSDEEIFFLQRLQWWNQNESWLKKHACLFSNIKDLMLEYNRDENK